MALLMFTDEHWSMIRKRLQEGDYDKPALRFQKAGH